MRFSSVVRVVLACLVFASFASCTPARAANYTSSNRVYCASVTGVAAGPACAPSVAAAAYQIAASQAGTWVTCGTGPMLYPVYKSNGGGSCSTPQALVWLARATCASADVLSSDLTTCTPLAESVTAYLAAEGVDSATVLYVYSWGMGAVLTMWMFGFAAGVAVKAINAL